MWMGIIQQFGIWLLLTNRIGLSKKVSISPIRDIILGYEIEDTMPGNEDLRRLDDYAQNNMR